MSTLRRSLAQAPGCNAPLRLWGSVVPIRRIKDCQELDLAHCFGVTSAIYGACDGKLVLPRQHARVASECLFCKDLAGRWEAESFIPFILITYQIITSSRYCVYVCPASDGRLIRHSFHHRLSYWLQKCPQAACGPCQQVET